MSLLKMKIQSTNYDELYTPVKAITPILKYLKPNSIIWCPFDKEESEYAKVLKLYGHKVINTHIDDKDFFDYKIYELKMLKIDYIISNPPYSIKTEILERLYKLGIPFMMLLPLTALEGIKRNNLYKQYGLELLILNKRIDFTGKNANYFNTSYFCWNVLPKQLLFAEIKET